MPSCRASAAIRPKRAFGPLMASTARRLDPETAFANRCVVCARRDEDNVVPVLEPRLDHAPNGTGTEDDEAHDSNTLTRLLDNA